jgi:two-component system, chemotaxis family, chemotaxis protein CheY
MYRVDCSRLRFLIVDDNPHMRRIIRALLHGFGVREAYEAEDGAAGLEAFSSYSPDIVIADWAMPIFDPPGGYEPQSFCTGDHRLRPRRAPPRA